MPGKSSLTRAVAQLETVEVMPALDALPRASTVLDWVEAAPPGFTYALTAPHGITHRLRLAQAEAATLAFLDVAASMGAAAAPVLFQFPRDFTRRRYGRALADWLAWLAPRRRGLRVAIEVHADDLATPAFASYLAALGFSFALIDRMNEPDHFEMWAAIMRAGNGPGFAYVRNVGDDHNGAAADRMAQHAPGDRIALWADRARWLVAEGQAVFAYVHSSSEDGAFAAARRLRAALEEEKRSLRVASSEPQTAEPQTAEPQTAETKRGAQLALL